MMGSSKEVARLSGINMRTNTYGIYVAQYGAVELGLTFS